MVLSLLRSFKYLAFTSLLGDVAVTAGIVSVVVYGLRDTGSPSFDLPQFQDSTFPKFVGSTAFLFAIHIVVSARRRCQSALVLSVTRRRFCRSCKACPSPASSAR